MNGNLFVTNIGELATPLGRKARRGSEMDALHVVRRAAIVAEKGKIVFAGSANSVECRSALARARSVNASSLDAKGRACVPGFVDSHTHFIFGGFRADEFFWRAEGLPYMEIHRRGGGIRRTMDATRGASTEELLALGKARLATMLSLGVTTVEGKSGYGLDLDTELRQLEVMKELAAHSPLSIVRTFLGPHSIPPEFAGSPSEYIDFVIEKVLPEVAAQKLADFADVFCEEGVFGIEDSRRYLLAARALGLGLKLHADEIARLGGAGLAAELAAVSADHLLKASREDLAKMREAGTIATCLPLTAFTLREPYADARAMIDEGLAVALASDLNPGSCYSQSIPLIFALSVLYMRLSFEETLTALTLNGAAALGLAESLGSIEPGKQADFLILDAPEASHLAYNVGMNLVAQTIKSGEVL
ncbi:MAG TPA: imidazolonepropionase [Rectinemataceae bacterium]|nr:imidazolonepropionase [Rectinemataceae bacterium]